jgi:hypothetical protein
MKNGAAWSEVAPAPLCRVHQFELDGCDTDEINEGRSFVPFFTPS